MVEYDLFLNSIDIKNAYLTAEMNKDVYVSQLELYVDLNNKYHVYKLNKSLYGHPDSGYNFYIKIQNYLKEIGGVPLILGASVFKFERCNGCLIY